MSRVQFHYAAAAADGQAEFAQALEVQERVAALAADLILVCDAREEGDGNEVIKDLIVSVPDQQVSAFTEALGDLRPTSDVLCENDLQARGIEALGFASEVCLDRLETWEQNALPRITVITWGTNDYLGSDGQALYLAETTAEYEAVELSLVADIIEEENLQDNARLRELVADDFCASDLYEVIMEATDQRVDGHDVDRTTRLQRSDDLKQRIRGLLQGEEDEPCEACEGRGWAVFESHHEHGITPNCLQRCDACEKFEDDIQAAGASGLTYTVRDRQTGAPCEANADHSWEAVIDCEVAIQDGV